jgi:sugar phosphate permease
VAERWGWRSAFYIYGGCGIPLGFVFMARLRDVPVMSQSESTEAPAFKFRQLTGLLGSLFRVPTALLLTVGSTAIVFVNNAYIVWMPEMLREKFHLSLTVAGACALFFHNLLALIGVLAGGWLSDRWVRRRDTARLWMMTCSMALGVPAIAMVGLSPILTLTCVATAVFGLFRGLYESNTHAALFDVIEPKCRASAVAMMVMCAFLVGSASPWLLGSLRQHLPPGRGFICCFAVMASAYAIGAISVAAALRWRFHRDKITETAA